MFTQFFGNYLINENIIKPQQLVDALKIKNNTKLKLGVLAINAGIMTSEQVEKVHEAQAKIDKRFGDIAVEMGFATSAQIEELLNAQKLDYLLLGQALIDNNILTNSEFENAINSYKKKFSLEDADFVSESSQKTQKIIKDFFDLSKNSNSELYSEYIELLFKNLIRFVGDDFTPINANKSALNSNLLISQNIIGSFNTAGIISGSEKALTAFSARYAQEEIDSFDELAQAGLSDFLNLHNGLFTVNVSQDKGIELNLTPPAFNSYDLENNDVLAIEICYPFGSVYFAFEI